MLSKRNSTLRSILVSLLSLILILGQVGGSTLSVFAEDFYVGDNEDQNSEQGDALENDNGSGDAADASNEASNVDSDDPNGQDNAQIPNEESGSDETASTEKPEEEKNEHAEKADNSGGKESEMTKGEDKEKTSSDIPDEGGASVHKENGLYEVMLFGAPADDKDDAANAIAEASKDDPEEETIPLNEAKKMSFGMFRALAAPASNSAQPHPLYPRLADGSDVEAISIRWITKDTEENNDDSLLYLVPDGDSAFSVRFQVDYALSGEHNYEPGDIQIRIPAQVFHKRDSNTTSENERLTGGMVIPLAQSPSAKTDFNWTLIDDEYVLTNTKNIVAATKGFIQFEIKNLIPHEIVDMSITDNLQATIEVTTHLGNSIGLLSNIIKAQVNTTQKVVRANKGKSKIEVVDSSKVGDIPKEISEKYPNDDLFLLIDWYVNAYHTGNQPYTLTATDTRTDVATGTTSETKHDGWIIDGDTTSTKDLGIVQEGWYSSGTSTSNSVKVAYPINK